MSSVFETETEISTNLTVFDIEAVVNNSHPNHLNKSPAVADLFLIIIDWINERPQLWNLEIQDLSLYARLEIYGDDDLRVT